MKILFASDIAFSHVPEFPGKEKVYQLMENTAKVFRSADFSMVNLENIFGEKENGAPIVKCGPNLISSADYVEYLNAIRPTVVGLANNHSGDFGEGVLFETIDILKENGYVPIGAGENIEKAYAPAILEKDGVSIAIFAICENEFGMADLNTAGAAGFNLYRTASAINSAKKEGHLPIIYFHGGNEFNPMPSPMKTQLYRHFIDLGAVAVIAMHTHCPQGYEYYNGKPIIYSMGNFYFPSTQLARSDTWRYGYMTMLTVDSDTASVELIPYKFDFHYHTPISGDEKDRFLKYIEHISKPIPDDALIREYFDAWCMLDKKIYRYLDQAFLTEEMTKEGAAGVRRTKNIFSCEAHNELLTNILRIIYEGREKEAEKRADEIERLQNMEF